MPESAAESAAEPTAEPATEPATDDRSRPRVLIVGAGFGGFFAARRLQRAQVDVTVLSATDGFLYQPVLPDVAVGTLDPRSALVPLSSTLRRSTIMRGRAIGVDFEAATVAYRDPDGEARDLGYDRLLLAPGSVTRLLDIPGLAEHAIGLKTATEALYLRDRVIARLEEANGLAANESSPARRRAALTFVVVGAGYAGTELTAQMARLTARLLPLHPHLRPQDVHWLLLDTAEAVMPELGASLGRSALELLERRGVDVRLGVSLESVSENRVVLTDGSALDCSTVVWSAGVTASPLIATLDLPTTKGRLDVDEYLRVPGHPTVYALGDAAAVRDATKPRDGNGDRPLCPPTAQHAMRQATAAARNIAADLGLGRRPARPYRHRDLGLVVDLGGPDAAATPLGLRLRGRPAKLVTRGYHLYALPTVKRRLRVATDWALAVGGPDDVSLGLPSSSAALAVNAEQSPG